MEEKEFVNSIVIKLAEITEDLCQKNDEKQVSQSSFSEKYSLVKSFLDKYKEINDIDLSNIDVIRDLLIENGFLPNDRKRNYANLLSIKSEEIYGTPKIKENIDSIFEQLFDACDKLIEKYLKDTKLIDDEIGINEKKIDSIGKAARSLRKFSNKEPLISSELLNVFSTIQDFSVLSGSEYAKFLELLLRKNSEFQIAITSERAKERKNKLEEARKKEAESIKKHTEIQQIDLTQFEKIKEKLKEKLTPEQFEIYLKLFEFRKNVSFGTHINEDLEQILLCVEPEKNGLTGLTETIYNFSEDHLLNCVEAICIYLLPLIEKNADNVKYDELLNVGNDLLDMYDSFKLDSESENIVADIKSLKKILEADKMSDKLEKVLYAEKLIIDYRELANDDSIDKSVYYTYYNLCDKLEKDLNDIAYFLSYGDPDVNSLFDLLTEYTEELEKGFAEVENSKTNIQFGDKLKLVYRNDDCNLICFPDGYDPIADIESNSFFENRMDSAKSSFLGALEKMACDTGILTANNHFIKHDKNIRMPDGSRIPGNGDHTGDCREYVFGCFRIIYETFDIKEVPGIIDNPQLGIMIYGVAYGRTDKVKTGEIDKQGTNHFRMYYPNNAEKIKKLLGKSMECSTPEEQAEKVLEIEIQNSNLNDIINSIVKGGSTYE